MKITQVFLDKFEFEAFGADVLELRASNQGQNVDLQTKVKVKVYNMAVGRIECFNHCRRASPYSHNDAYLVADVACIETV